jgi:hypothetical protein
MSREDHRRYDAALLKLRAEMAEKAKSAPIGIPLEGIIGLLMEIAVLILGHLHVREPFAIWGLFILGLALVSDWVIRLWAPSHPERDVRRMRLRGMLAVVISAAVLVIFISKGLEPDEVAATRPSSTASAPQTPLSSPNTGIVGIYIPPGKGATLDNVHLDAFGTTGIRNSSAQLNFKNSSIKHNQVGLDNQNPEAQINFEGSEISGNKVGMINRGPTKPDENKKPKQP